MEQTLSITRSSRKVLHHFADNFTLEQLNIIPPGFNNNIIWNIGHIIVVQQMLVYRLSGLPMHISDEMVERYKRGTKPQTPATQFDVDEIKTLLNSTIDKAETDLNNGIFREYQSFTTMSGFELTNVPMAMEFNNYHEGVHTGYIMSLRKFI